MFYALNSWLDSTRSLTEARFMAGLSVEQCMALCDVSERTWYRWRKEGAPRWATRLIISQAGHLDHLGWKDWEIRAGRLYFNQLSYRYWWEPVHLVMPLYGMKEQSLKSLAPHTDDDNLSNVIPLHKAVMAR